MKTLLSLFTCLFLSTSLAIGQVGHVMQGSGSFNMSMGGAATGQSLDISGSLLWNPASLSAYDADIYKVDVGIFFSAPELRSTVPEFDNLGQPTGNYFSGVTKDDRGISIMPAIAMVWGKSDSKHTFGFSAFGISGFGVTFPENMTNPINMPQNMGGFGHIESDYAMMQLGVSYAYQLTDNLSLGIQPNFNFATLELAPNPTSNPTSAGYPSTDKAPATGYGAQFGLFYSGDAGFKAGLSYKTTQILSDFELDNTYMDNTTGTNSMNMDYPAIASVGVGYSQDLFDFALDYRYVDYENTNGFDQTGWTETGSVSGFGWNNISVISTGFQYKGFDRIPLRAGYTYSTNPIQNEIAFFNIPATAIIKNAFQIGIGFEATSSITIDALFHRGMSGESTTGQLLNPMFVSPNSPLGEIPGSEVSYDMTTDMMMFGFTYTIN